VGFSLFSGLRNAGLDPVAQNVPFELGENGQHAGERPSARRGQVDGLAQRDKSDFEGNQLLQRVHQIHQGTSPAVQAPDHDEINVPPPRSR
jgi:hypothetical protein